MPFHEPLPIKVDRITARVLETLSPSRRKEMDAKFHALRHNGDRPSVEMRFDAIDISHPQVTSVTIKATAKRVETEVNLVGAYIRNGRTITIRQELPLSLLASLKKRAANDVVDTDLLEGHTVLWARDDEIHLKEEEWVDIATITSTGQDLKPITKVELIDGIEALGIKEIDCVFLRYIDRITKLRHLLLARIAAYMKNGKEHSTTTVIHDLADWMGGERAFFSVKNGQLRFTVESAGHSARYSNGYFSHGSKRFSQSAQIISNMVHMLPRIKNSDHYRQTTKPYRTIAKIRENFTKYNYLG
jgi:hypothetical protein